MRYAYDTEFLEDGKTIELISIGIVAEDGRELYLINRDAPWRRIKKDEWLMANVVPRLPQPHGDWRNHMPKRWPIDFHHSAVKRRAQIADQVERFLLGDDLETYSDLELWADYGAYDHVALCQLFGRMVDLPPGIPMFTSELQQQVGRDGASPTGLPAQRGAEHNALDDARWVMACLKHLDQL